MNYEELESLWAGQPAVTPGAALAELQHAILPEFRRRSRMLGYGITVCVLNLMIMPGLAVVNFRSRMPAHPAWYWSYQGTWIILLATILVVLVRRAGRERMLLAHSADTVSGLAGAALRSVEQEMKEYRREAWWIGAMIVFQLLNLYVQFPVTIQGWQPFAARAGFVLGLSLAMGLVFWRHYRVNLIPQQRRQREILQGLEAGETTGLARG